MYWGMKMYWGRKHAPEFSPLVPFLPQNPTISLECTFFPEYLFAQMELYIPLIHTFHDRLCIDLVCFILQVLCPFLSTFQLFSRIGR